MNDPILSGFSIPRGSRLIREERNGEIKTDSGDSVGFPLNPRLRLERQPSPIRLHDSNGSLSIRAVPRGPPQPSPRLPLGRKLFHSRKPGLRIRLQRNRSGRDPLTYSHCLRRRRSPLRNRSRLQVACIQFSSRLRVTTTNGRDRHRADRSGFPPRPPSAGAETPLTYSPATSPKSMRTSGSRLQLGHRLGCPLRGRGFDFNSSSGRRPLS